MLPVAVTRFCFDGSAMLCTSGFMNDITFSHDGANGPESKITYMFRPVRLVAHGMRSPLSSTASCLK